MLSVQYLLFMFIALVLPPQSLQAKRYKPGVPLVSPYKYAVKHAKIQEGDTDKATPALLNIENMEEEKVHIQEHLDVPINVENMTEREMQFHYFKIADADKNNMLDGQELIYFIIHRHTESIGENGTAHANHTQDDNQHDSSFVRIFTDQELTNAIDPVLEDHDSNNDGMIDWHEFASAIDPQDIEEQDEKEEL